MTIWLKTRETLYKAFILSVYPYRRHYILIRKSVTRWKLGFKQVLQSVNCFNITVLLKYLLYGVLKESFIRAYYLQQFESVFDIHHLENSNISCFVASPQTFFRFYFAFVYLIISFFTVAVLEATFYFICFFVVQHFE